MAENIYEKDSIIVTRLIGGTASTAGRREPGVCYQINESDRNLQLTRAEAIAVAQAILHDSRHGAVPPSLT